MTPAYYYDTYAILALYRGSARYGPYRQATAFTSLMNLFEVRYKVMESGRPEEARRLVERFRDCVVPFGEAHIQRASAFKLLHRRRGVSYVDALGYTLAAELGVPFLTGDPAFRGIPGVEFVEE